MRKQEGKKSYFFQVSTKPDISSYMWAGTELSLLSTVILWMIWLCRFLSLFQHIKAHVRIIGSRRGRTTTDNRSGRPNIPPMMGEIYYLIWSLFVLLCYLLGWRGTVFRILLVYYLFESSVWIFYYTVFRRFFELGYTIYHTLEYITAIFLIIPTQALGFALLYGRTFREMLLGLLGATPDSAPFPVAVLGCMFAAIVISMIISTFPTEKVKQQTAPPSMFVVGCGDVVQQRLYPALKDYASASQTRVYDLASATERAKYCTYLKTQPAICREISRHLAKKDVVWIETPSHTHISYLKHFLDSDAKLIVLEKPIAITWEDLAYVEETVKISSKRNRIFFLSYYALEKALPLHYLTNFNEHYEKYLHIDDVSLIMGWRELLGTLRQANVCICEEKDERDWVYTHGGQLLETFLHNVLIAALVCGQPQNWTHVTFPYFSDTKDDCRFTLEAKCGQADIRLSLNKNAAPEETCRYAEFLFENGSIKADLETQQLTIYFQSMDEYSTISVQPAYRDRYSIMVDMVASVADGTYTAAEADGLTGQISALKWLLELKDKQN